MADGTHFDDIETIYFRLVCVVFSFYIRESLLKDTAGKKDGRSIHAAKKEGFIHNGRRFVSSWEIKKKKTERDNTTLYIRAIRAGLVECRETYFSRLCDYFGNFLS